MEDGVVFVHKDFFAVRKYRDRRAVEAGVEPSFFKELKPAVAELILTDAEWIKEVAALPSGASVLAYRGVNDHAPNKDCDVVELTTSDMSRGEDFVRRVSKKQLGKWHWFSGRQPFLYARLLQAGQDNTPVREMEVTSQHDDKLRVLVVLLARY
jgi:hypothetical protein